MEMTRHALSNGRALPAAILHSLQSAALAVEPPEGSGPPRVLSPDELKGLTQAHNHLARVVAPATPQTLLLLKQNAQSVFSFLGPLPFVRRMMLATICCLVLFIGLSLNEYVNVPDEGDIFKGEGVPLLLNELFFMAAAGLGASFAALFEASRYIADCSFEERFEATYWIKFFLGLVAGLILVTLVPIQVSQGMSEVTRPTLAMLGGFSATAVYRMITRLVETVESLVRGDNKELLASRERAAKARATEEAVQHRMKLASKLVTLQQQLGASDQEQVRAQLSQFVRSLMSDADHLEDMDPTPTASANTEPAPAEESLAKAS
jgi:hypothetical protein